MKLFIISSIVIIHFLLVIASPPSVEDINFFEVDPPGIFHFFALTPLEILVFSSNFDISR